MNFIKRLIYSIKGVEYLKIEDVLKIDDWKLLTKIHSMNRYEEVRQLAAYIGDGIIRQINDIPRLTKIYNESERIDAFLISHAAIDKLAELIAVIEDRQKLAQFLDNKYPHDVRHLAELKLADKTKRIELVKADTNYAFSAINYSVDLDLLEFLSFDYQGQRDFRQCAQRRLIFLTTNRDLLKRLSESNELSTDMKNAAIECLRQNNG